MADDKPLIHIDTDWKRQAQEEKKRLAEQEAKKVPVAPPAAAASTTATPVETTGRMPGMPREPLTGFAGMVQSILTQVLFYLGELAVRGHEPQLNLDGAKQQIDNLAILDEKTKGNLTEAEQKLLDTALYETRMRFVSIASQLV
jgi:hypothetical protein